MGSGAYFSFDLVGWKELDQALQMIENTAMQKSVLRGAMKKALKPVADMAERLVPVDQGDLKKTIRVSSTITKRQQKEQARTGAVKMYVGTNWPTAHLVEFGTGPRQVRVKRRKVLAGGGEIFGVEADVGAMPAKPFLRPAFDCNVKRVLDIFGQEMWKNLERTAKRLYKQAKAGKLKRSGERALGVG